MYDIFKDREDDLADKQFFFGKLPFEVSDVYDWNKHMELLNTHPDKLIDSNTNKFRIGLNCFHERPSAPDFARHIESEMQEVFSMHNENGGSITNIAFTGIGKNSDSYPWHNDTMDVFLVQVLASVEMRVEGHNDDKPFWFNPGDYVWLPRGTHHQIIPHDSRVSFSFGVEGSPDPATYF
jgi:hypothetical protein|tara:strand:+ start:90 stop:629 length:540 start_codon:yes stop_codon:yes gene_type:complete